MKCFNCHRPAVVVADFGSDGTGACHRHVANVLRWILDGEPLGRIQVFTVSAWFAREAL